MQLVRQIQVGVDMDADADGCVAIEANRIHYAGQPFRDIDGTNFLGMESAVDPDQAGSWPTSPTPGVLCGRTRKAVKNS